MAAERSELAIRTAKIIKVDRRDAMFAADLDKLDKLSTGLSKKHFKFAQIRFKAIQTLLKKWEPQP